MTGAPAPLTRRRVLVEMAVPRSVPRPGPFGPPGPSGAPASVPRRRMLGWLAGGGLGVAAAAAGLHRWVLTAGGEPTGPLAGIRRIGVAYLDREPEEASAPVLASHLPDGWQPPTEGPARSFAALGPQVREDFAAGRTVEVAGWKLARTEARAAALVALSFGDRG